ncbi:MAG: aldo/keto reductase [Verrucomicrobia bacterium]|nr:aldo/keto reductase [Verrucomicrobiota bacterium]
MNHRRLGKTGLKVSEICLGNWLTHGAQIDAAESAKIVRAAFDLGINFFDTADAYANGKAEEVLGRAIGGLRRQEIVVATKCWWSVRGKGPTTLGHSRKHVMEAMDASLRRLRLDHVDLYQLHRYDETAPLEETLGALNDLVHQGKTHYVGCSNYNPKLMREAFAICKRHDWAWFVSNQPNYSLMCRTPERGLIQVCEKQGVGLIVYCPQAQGFLTGKYRSLKDARKGTRIGESDHLRKHFLTGANFRRIDRLCDMAAKANCTPGQLALRWVLRKEAVSSAIVGARSVRQVRESAAASDIKVSEAQLNQLSRIFPAT